VILNWLTIVVATAVYYGLAALWFADPLFGREWQRSVEWRNEAGETIGIVDVACFAISTCSFDQVTMTLTLSLTNRVIPASHRWRNEKMTKRTYFHTSHSTHQEAQKAIRALNGTDLEGRNLTVNEARPQERRFGFGGDRGGERRGGGGRNRW